MSLFQDLLGRQLNTIELSNMDNALFKEIFSDPDSGAIRKVILGTPAVIGGRRSACVAKIEGRDPGPYVRFLFLARRGVSWRVIGRSVKFRGPGPVTPKSEDIEWLE